VSLHARAIRKAPPTLSAEAMRLLLAYPWPGNVRELSNVVERAVILASGPTLEPEDLPPEFRQPGGAPTELKQAVEQFERQHIALVLRLSGGNREQAAKMLNVDPATLYRRLSKYQVG
jgi:DNA-binding NtrC family response regulator